VSRSPSPSQSHVRLGSKASFSPSDEDVRYTPVDGHHQGQSARLKRAKLGSEIILRYAISSVQTLKLTSVFGPERLRDWNIGGIAPLRDQNTADPRHVVARIEGAPVPAEFSSESSLCGRSKAVRLRARSGPLSRPGFG
jgi:hypothetical protein